MKPIQKVLILDEYKYYEKHLSIVSCLLPTNLTQKETEVLASFLSLDPIIIDEEVFNPISRKKVMEKMNLKPGGLSNYLKSMVDKKVLIKNPITKSLKIQPFLLPTEPIQGYQIKIKKQ